MCDMFSWGVPKCDIERRGQSYKKDDILFLTDAMVEDYELARSERERNMSGNPNLPDRMINWEDYGGHSGIFRVLGIEESMFTHMENRLHIPAVLAKAVNAGKLDKIIKRAFHEDPAHTRYKITGSVGTLKGSEWNWTGGQPRSSKVWTLIRREIRYILDNDFEIAMSEKLDLYNAVTKAIREGADPFGVRETLSIFEIVDTSLSWDRFPDYTSYFSELNSRLKETLRNREWRHME